MQHWLFYYVNYNIQTERLWRRPLFSLFKCLWLFRPCLLCVAMVSTRIHTVALASNDADTFIVHIGMLWPHITESFSVSLTDCTHHSSGDIHAIHSHSCGYCITSGQEVFFYKLCMDATERKGSSQEHTKQGSNLKRGIHICIISIL